MNIPMSLDLDDDDEEEEGKDQNKGEDQDKDSEKKTPQTNPRFLETTTLTPHPPTLHQTVQQDVWCNPLQGRTQM